MRKNNHQEQLDLHIIDRIDSRDQSNLVPSYVSGNYYGYYIQLGVRGYLGLKVLRLGWERFKKCVVYMAQDLCGYYTRIT